jgi:uridine kinase
MSLIKYNTKRNLKKSGEPMIIGIAGPSGSGKTTLAKELVQKINAKLIHLDNYWKYDDVKKIPPMKKWKKGIWEKPSSTDFNKALKDARRLKKPKNFNYFIMEGLHTFNNKKVLDMLDFKIYIDIPEKSIVKRRLKKFGTKDNQEWYSKNIAIKFYKKYGEPKKVYADLILNGKDNIDKNIKKILKYINKS